MGLAQTTRSPALSPEAGNHLDWFLTVLILLRRLLTRFADEQLRKLVTCSLVALLDLWIQLKRTQPNRATLSGASVM